MLPPRNDVATYYQHADVFLSASRTEGFSYALLEAALCDPLIIVSDIPQSTSSKIPHMSVFVGNDIEDGVSKLYALLLLDDTEREDIKKQQKEFVKETYKFEVWAKKVIAHYK